MRHTLKTAVVLLVLPLVGLLATPTRADADITAFLGASPTPSSRLVTGFAGGFNLLILGFELEYADTREDLAESAPRLRTFTFNGLLQTPVDIAGMRFYGTAGGGVYRETLGDVFQETHLAINVGGGVKMRLAGPLRLRLDYRVFTLRGTPLHSRPQRVYAGLNLAF